MTLYEALQDMELAYMLKEDPEAIRVAAARLIVTGKVTGVNAQLCQLFVESTDPVAFLQETYRTLECL